MNKTAHSQFRPICLTENIDAIAQNVHEHSSTSTRHCFQEELIISRTSLRIILHKNLGLKAYIVQLIQKNFASLPWHFQITQWAFGRK